MKLHIARLRVIATQVVTWIIALGAGITAGAAALTSQLSSLPAWLGDILPSLTTIAGLLTTAGLVIRRVTEVAKDQRGILPTSPPAPQP